jgi:hypothetical protein
MNLKPVISQFVLLDHQLIIILWHKKVPFSRYGFMLNLQMEHEDQEIALE